MRQLLEKYGLLSIVVLIFLFAGYRRAILFPLLGSGGDSREYISAAQDFIEGTNPYISTVESFKHLEEDPGGKGFSYLPGLLYINSFFLSVHAYITNILPCNPLLDIGYCVPLDSFWKLPTFLADLGVGFILFKYMWKKNRIATVFALLVWFFNPFMVLKNDFIRNDPIPIFFMFLSLYYLGKDDVAAGASYAFAVGTKTFPIFILPVILMGVKNKKDLFLSGAIVALFLSFPFIGSIYDFNMYLQGAVFVHSERFVQGRPFLFYISYWLDIIFIRLIPTAVYTYLATFGGWLTTVIVNFTGWLKDRFALSALSLMIFYAFTPVLNRTYLLWFLPVFIVGLFNITHGYIEGGGKLVDKLNSKNSKYVYYTVLAMYWIFYLWYLYQWKDGFHIHARI